MKQPKKLSREQKRVVVKEGLEPAGWMLVHESKIDLQIINKFTSEIKTISKERTGKW